MIKINKKITRYFRILIEKIFAYFIRNRVDNSFLLYMFYHLWSVLNFFYYEYPFIKERNHYIPQPLLRNFRIKDSGQVFQFSDDMSNPKIVSIAREAACETDYYTTFKMSGCHSNFIEKNLYADICEKFGINIINKIINNEHKTLISLEEYILSLYASSQYTRTPSFRIQLKFYIYYLLKSKKVDVKIFSNKGKRILTEIFVNNSLMIKNKEVQDFFKSLDINNFDLNEELLKYIENSEAIIRSTSVLIGSALHEKLFRKHITILECENPYYFVVPDSGVMIYEKNTSWPYGWEFEDKNIILFLPISPNKCLLFSTVVFDEKIHLSLTKIAMSLGYLQKYRYVFSNRKNISDII